MQQRGDNYELNVAVTLEDIVNMAKIIAKTTSCEHLVTHLHVSASVIYVRCPAAAQQQVLVNKHSQRSISV